jgi:hypothetical protein
MTEEKRDAASPKLGGNSISAGYDEVTDSLEI